MIDLPQVALDAASKVLKLSISSIPPVLSNCVIPYFPLLNLNITAQ